MTKATISGFTMVRNATKYYFPIKECILSALPIVDEFVIALGEGDLNDKTREEILSIGSDKIKIIERGLWDEQLYKDGGIFRHETNIAKEHCTGDWCLYLQADELIHEKDYQLIQDAADKYLDRKDVDGFLFNYYHFWGDYDHYMDFYGWYPNEIRIVRNIPEISSYLDAQSFRRTDNTKLRVIDLPAFIYHYGWVRPPKVMVDKKGEQDSIHRGDGDNSLKNSNYSEYGPMKMIPLFKGTHPSVMKTKIQEIFWKDQLDFTSDSFKDRQVHKHEKTKYLILTFIKRNFFKNRKFPLGWKNWNIISE
ncbi:hypothetical protein SAMN04515674_11345 [Pseudarcicella hirudinis]|uniref:Glycosyl transferase family 2 n=1 Tax=Pseudarcicella hirudinis TaxID=1079859 RepID=A0A1I5X084_9BACT|nr:hypothetical protein [Pseudarcicella hirudinis]SFQ25310.1 hypothetical protein SAMN04515674_11345 [Pseudarcicella hirudinis]